MTTLDRCDKMYLSAKETKQLGSIMKFKVGDKVQIYNDNSDINGFIGTVTDIRDINGFIRKVTGVTGVRDINRQILGYDNLSFYRVDVYHNGRVRGMNFIDDELRAPPCHIWLPPTPPPTVEYNNNKTIKMSTSMRVSIWTFVALQVVFLYIAFNT